MLGDVTIERVERVKVELDAFYEAITVRIFASTLDYTTDAKGNIVSGSKDRPRRFSEYWTFIAAVGADLTRPASLTSCPSCGAPVNVTQAGACAHCEAVVTRGTFGWVLSRIEQDESYGG